MNYLCGMGRKKPNPLLENIEITDIAAEGNAIARVDNLVLFVPYGIPGDIVDIQVTKKRKNYMEGYITALRKPSSLRIDPECSHFGTCGGCKWQHLPYQEQLRFKQKQVSDSLERIGKVIPHEFFPILPSENTSYYRNKLEYTFSNKRWLTKEEIASGGSLQKTEALGFHIPGMFDKVLDIKECFHQTEPSNRIRLALKDFALKNEIVFFDLREQKGILRTLIIRNNLKNEFMVIVSFFSDEKATVKKVMEFLRDTFPEIKSLHYVINPKANDTISDLEVIHYHGDDHIIEELEGIRFRISPKSFFQTNSRQAYNLYKITREFAGLTGKENVYDLYTGTGTIALFMAAHCAKVTGIEYVPEAIEDAKVNAKLNDISNSSFYAGDMKDVLQPAFIAEHGQPDVIILDPPRAGVHEKVIEVIKNAAPSRIVYVSCNPASQARDISMLSDAYALVKVQPVDMFPHTHHVENVALLIRR